MAYFGTIGAMIEVPVAALNQDFRKLIEALTVVNPKWKSAQFFGKGFAAKKVQKHIHFYTLNDTTRTIAIPRNIGVKYIKPQTTLKNTTCLGRDIVEGKTNTFKLRPKQHIYINTKILPYIENSLQNLNTCDLLMNVPCGGGKTLMSLYLSDYYRVSTLCCVTTKKIGNQFIAGVKNFFPNWSIGWAKAGQQYDITIATYSLLSQPTYTEKYFLDFGHIIFDEYHRAAAETYNAILAKAPCKYRTTLTATFRRKDGLHKMLKHHIGEVIEMPNDGLVADIYPVITGVSINEEQFRNVNMYYTKIAKLEQYADIAVINNKRKEVDRGCVIDININSNRISLKSSLTFKEVLYNATDYGFKELGVASIAAIDTEISEIAERADLVLAIIAKCYEVGRTIIVLSKRKEFLFSMAKRLDRYGIPNGVIVSDKDRDYKEFVAKKGMTVEQYITWCFEESKVLLGIDKLAEEGMDMPRADTLCYVHPIRDIEQSIGRIIRDNEGVDKFSPMAFYLTDKVSCYTSAFYGNKGALKMFVDLGHKVHKEITKHEIKQTIQNGTQSK